MSALLPIRSARESFDQIRALRESHHVDTCKIVFVVGCGAQKRNEPSEAHQLYTSPLFRKAIALSLMLGDSTAIASAKHGLVALQQRIAPYTLHIDQLTRRQRMSWAGKLVRDLDRRYGTEHGRILPVLLMGAHYAEPIEEVLEATHTSLSRVLLPYVPLRGLEIGDRLAMLNEQIAQGTEVAQ